MKASISIGSAYYDGEGWGDLVFVPRSREVANVRRERSRGGCFDGRSGVNTGATPAMGRDDTTLSQESVRGRDRARADLELVCQCSHGWQLGAWRQSAFPNRIFDTVADIGGASTGDTARPRMIHVWREYRSLRGEGGTPLTERRDSGTRCFSSLGGGGEGQLR